MKYELFVICNILIIIGLVISSEAVDLWKYHLQLYTGHCSEVALCDNVTNHLEPLEILALVPCCVPCSCLPTCSKRQNCCPNFGDSAKNLTGNQTIGNEFELYHVNQSYIGLDNGADIDNDTSRKWALKGSQNLNFANPRNQSQRRQLA